MTPVDEYESFLKQPPHDLKAHPRYDEMRETIAFMVSRGKGRASSVPTREIVEHLQDLAFDITQTQWQIGVLGPLRDAGIYIGSERGKTGMFLIADRGDAEATRSAQLQRLEAEQSRLKTLETLMKKHGWPI